MFSRVENRKETYSGVTIRNTEQTLFLQYIVNRTISRQKRFAICMFENLIRILSSLIKPRRLIHSNNA